MNGLYETTTDLIKLEIHRYQAEWDVAVKQYRVERSITLAEFKSRLAVIANKKKALQTLAFKMSACGLK